MQMEEFKINIKGIIEKVSGKEVGFKRTKKNNGIELEGIMVGDLETANTLSPIIYLENYLEDYNSGKSLFQIADSILEKIEKNKLHNVEAVSILHSWDEVKDKIKVKLINYEKNQEYLCDIPHQKILDLVIICYIEMEDMVGKGIATVTINHKLLEFYGVGFDEVMDQADRNTKDFQIQRIEEVLLESLIEEGEISEEEKSMLINGLSREGYPDMYILSNKNKSFGAIGIMDKELMKQFGEKINSDFYIIPSSVHETILVSTSQTEQEVLKEMIRSVNDEQVEEEEILSYNLYRYDYRGGDIIVSS